MVLKPGIDAVVKFELSFFSCPVFFDFKRKT